jgi:pimeloyl-ACP methyl ester carboxylesterase
VTSAIGMVTRNVTVAGTRFLLREMGSGSGTPVLLLHGVPETSSVWRDVQPLLATGRRVLAPDLPGLGGSAYTGPYDMPSVVEQLVALLDHELPGQSVDVVGHDWGGVAALWMAGLHPGRVRRLAVANAPLGNVNPLRAVHVPLFALPAVPELLFRLGGKRVVDLMLHAGWKAQRPLDPERQAEYVAAYTEPERVSAMLGYYRAAARPVIAAGLHLGSAPPSMPHVSAERMLVIWGAADPVLPISAGEAVVKELGADCVMVTIPGAGHFVIEEAPDVVAAALVDFLAADG